MRGAASFVFRCARCSGTPVWVRGGRSSRRCPYRVAVPPVGGGAPPALGGRRAAPVAPQLGWVRGGGGATPLALWPVWEGGGGVGGVLRSLGDAPCRPKGGGAAWRSRPRGPAIGQGGRALPPPPSTESRILTQSLPGAPHPPAVAARRWPAGGGREGQRSVVSGLRGRFPWVGNKAGVPWCRAVHGGRGHPYYSGSRPPGFSGHDLRGVPVRRRGPTCSSRPPFEPAAGAWGRVTLRLPSWAGGSVPSASGGWGRGPRGWRASGGAGGGGVAPRPPCSRSRRRPVVLLPGSLRVAGALPSAPFRSKKSILRFIFSGCASFSWFFIFFCCDPATPSPESVLWNSTLDFPLTVLRVRFSRTSVALCFIFSLRSVKK